MARVLDERRYGPTTLNGPGFRQVSYAPLGVHSSHRHDVASITLILGGDLEEGTHSGTRRRGSLTAVVKPPEIVHEDVYGPRGTRTFQITVDPCRIAEFGSDLSYGWYEGGPLARTMLQVLRAAREGELARQEDVDRALVDVFASIPHGTTDRGVEPRWMESIVERLRADYSAPVCARELAEGVGMHPVSFARAFRRHFGCSMTEYLRRRRVANACRLMEAPTETLADVAMAAGFSDQPHLTRAFRRETGVTPGQFRALAS